jgi:hypothetical protein
VVTGIIWRENGDSLLSCSKDGIVQQLDMATQSLATYATLNTAAITWNVYDDLAFVNEQIDRATVITEKYPPKVFPQQYQYQAAGMVEGSKTSLTPRGSIHMGHIQVSSSPSSSSDINLMSDTDVLIYCAHHYRLTGDTVHNICAHNKQVALDIHREQLAQMWSVIVSD